MREKMFRLASAFSKKDKTFLFLAIIVNMLIAFDYAIVRPVSQSIFLAVYGASTLPYVWIVVLPISLGVVFLYNRFLPKLGCFRVFAISAALISIANTLAAFFLTKHPIGCFLFYVWKEIYILLMLQQLWSIIHATVDLKKAKYLYGILFGLGALGASFGSLIPSLLAVQMGSQSLLFASLPVYSILVALYFLLLRFSGTGEVIEGKETKKYSSLREGFSLIASSKLLLAILLMTVFMQVTSTTTTFQFQALLEKCYVDVDIRTAFTGKLLFYGNLLTMSLQFFGTFLLLRLFGMQKTHFTVPLVLGLSSFFFLLSPTFGAVASSFVLIKAFDFSLFCAVKEMLYIPMRLEEKFQAKAIIDVFAYRASKIIASFLIIGLQVALPTLLMTSLSWINFVLFVFWAILISMLKNSYQDSEGFSLRKRGSV